MMFYIIYKLTNKQNGKFYIGITSEGLQHRFRGHVRKSRFNPTSNLHQAIAKHGEDNFSKEILHSFETEDKKYAYSVEQEFISKYNAVTLGYNMDIGFGWACADRAGENNPMFGKVSGNAHKVVIHGEEYSSITAAGKALNKNRATISRWIADPKKPDCYEV